jgi:hypothetical protein
MPIQVLSKLPEQTPPSLLQQLLLPQLVQGAQQFGAGMGTSLLKEQKAQEFAKATNVPLGFARFFVDQHPQIQKQLLEQISSAIPENIESPAQQREMNLESTREGTSLLGPTRQQQELALKEKQIKQKETEAAWKYSKQDIEDITKGSKQAKEFIQDLNRMQDIEKEGQINTPFWNELLKRSGFDIPALKDPGSQEFDKIAANFQRMARSIYGARISNFEISQFLRTIPDLSQTPEGRKRIIANLKRINRGAIEYFKTMRQIIKENKNIPPYDLRIEIEHKIGKRLKKITQQFKEDLKKPTTLEEPSKWATGLGAVLGEIAGIQHKLVSKITGIGGGGEGGEIPPVE